MHILTFYISHPHQDIFPNLVDFDEFISGHGNWVKISLVLDWFGQKILDLIREGGLLVRFWCMS